MISRSIGRWKSFWLGVLVLGFLVWAWLSTREESALLHWIMDARIHTIKSGGGSVGIGWMNADLAMDWHFETSPVEDKRAHYFAPAFERDWEEVRYIAVAYWVVVLGFLVAWGGFLMWRWRRVGKLMPSHVMPGSGIASESPSARTREE